MLSALQNLMGVQGVESEWARERVRKLFSDAAAGKPEPEPEPEMRVTLGNIRLTVSGSGMALLLAPGLKPGSDDSTSLGNG
ncbi:hypothetical protein [Azoarcus sp. DD4]|uniref:hypothetical protein n=1 Tax=Azoarcus sp. DD4 TaxID=2027405 RepID=UPI00112CAA96|nr:hypothetical protein [Azoarcus sp. DD4]